MNTSSEAIFNTYKTALVGHLSNTCSLYFNRDTDLIFIEDDARKSLFQMSLESYFALCDMESQIKGRDSNSDELDAVGSVDDMLVYYHFGMRGVLMQKESPRLTATIDLDEYTRLCSLRQSLESMAGAQ